VSFGLLHGESWYGWTCRMVKWNKRCMKCITRKHGEGLLGKLRHILE
jgi:hypothetical protein